MPKKIIFPFFFLLVLFLPLPPAYAQKADNPCIWEKEIRAFEEKDSMEMPVPGVIVFTGSSSIRGWRSLNVDYPEKDVLNRGFGGSRIGDATFYFDRIIAKYEPKQVVLYSGENDIASGKTPEMVLEQFKEFAQTMKEELPKTELVFLSLKPSIARWEMYEDMEEANRKIKHYAFWHRRVKFVDVSTPMLGVDGKPRPELFIGDGLHLTPEGYRLWTKIVEPYLAK